MSTTRSEQRSRQRVRQPVNTNQFHVEEGATPDGMSYEWKRYTYAGKEDVKHMNNMLRNGFTPVPAHRHPEIVGHQFAKENPDSAIIVDGQMLMERPNELREEADVDYYNEAASQVSNHVNRLKLTPDGQLPRRVQSASKKYDIKITDDKSEEKRD